jgi:hypothetical protein
MYPKPRVALKQTGQSLLCFMYSTRRLAALPGAGVLLGLGQLVPVQWAGVVEQVQAQPLPATEPGPVQRVELEARNTPVADAN